MGNKATFEKVDLADALIGIHLYDRICQLERQVMALEAKVERTEHSAEYVQGLSRE